MRNLPMIRQEDLPHSNPPARTRYGYKSEYEAEEITLTFPGMSMSAFMRQTMAYEDLPVPISRRLRQGAWVGMAMTFFGATCLLLLLIFPQILSGMGQLPVLMLAGLLHNDVQWMASRPLFFIGDGLLLASGIFLLARTRNLQAGKPLLHWLALAQALGGCANALLLALPLVILGLNLLLWVLIVLIIVTFIVFVFGMMM
jgi:hypothetical protein